MQGPVIKIGDNVRDAFSTQILRIVSHELRTPLNAIIGFAELLARPDPPSDDDRIEYAHLIAEGGQDLLASINALLDLARIEAGGYGVHLELIDAVALLERCCRAVSGDHDMEIERQGGREVLLMADRKALSTLLTHLIINAFKFTGDEGEIELSVHSERGGVVFFIADNGCGIAPDIISGVSAPFAQGKMDYSRAASGAGLGLAIVKGLVKLHDGKLTIESAPGAGTKVSIWLPTAGVGQNDGEILDEAA